MVVWEREILTPPFLKGGSPNNLQEIESSADGEA